MEKHNKMKNKYIFKKINLVFFLILIFKTVSTKIMKYMKSVQ